MLAKISIRSLMTSVFSINILLVCTTIACIILLDNTHGELGAKKHDSLMTYKSIDELRQSLDDLTRLVRTYAVTGDEKYKKMYHDVLDIRSGKKARPSKYEQIYWDFVLNYGDKPKPDGEKVALLDTIKQLGISNKEYALLAKTQENSEALAKIEIEAMNALKTQSKNASNQGSLDASSNTNKAISMLHNQKYHQAKADVVKPLEAFFDELERRTNQEVSLLESRVLLLETLGAVSLLITLISAVLGYFVVRFKVLNPISKINHDINEIAENSDLTLVLKEGNDEIGNVGVALNKLLAQVKEGIQRFIVASKQMNDTAEQVGQFVSQTETKGREQNSQLTMVATAMEEIVSTLKEVASSVNSASDKTAQSEQSAQEGQQSMSATNAVFDQLISSFERSSMTITELSEESTNMSNVLDVIKAIAEQTNLLALNAAIEAARAGEQGRGFAVVADEVRTLAQRSQESASEIEQMLGQLQAKAKNATASITQSQEDMNKTKVNIDEVSEVLTGITSSASQINHLNTSVATATQEQQVVLEDVNMNINHLHELSNQSVEDMQAFLKVSGSLQQASEETQKVTSQFKV